jgi:hypothetical protein
MKLPLDKAAIAIVVLAPVIACATNVDVAIGSDCASGLCADSGSPGFIAPVPDGGDAEASLPRTPLLACVGTKCPAPCATCPNDQFLCETNLQNDDKNCGECGNSCGDFELINMIGRCVKGACAFECSMRLDPNRNFMMQFRDCNNLIDDGCEIDISDDPANCGACGNACAAGERCIKGRCGCPPPLTDCHGRCVDTRSDDGNCGACDHECDPIATECNPPRPNTQSGCSGSVCGKVKCMEGYGDCNHDLDEAYTDKGCRSDGCETNLQIPDPNNCGKCGLKCLPGQECRDEGYGLQCLDACAKAGLTLCPLPTRCVDLLSDRDSCGICNNRCPLGAFDGAYEGHQVSSCSKGFCKLECVVGFGDCNNDPSDGCEVDLSRNPASCGSCGNACDADAGAGSDGGAGQPCIEGKCLMVECDPGGQPK